MGIKHVEVKNPLAEKAILDMLPEDKKDHTPIVCVRVGDKSVHIHSPGSTPDGECGLCHAKVWLALSSKEKLKGPEKLILVCGTCFIRATGPFFMAEHTKEGQA